MKKSPNVLIVDGELTGTGVVHNLTVCGPDMIFVEKEDLTYRTTKRVYGLLHSGGRYTVSDQPSTKGCIEEDYVLRRIAGHCVEMTGGLFVQHPEDFDEYFEKELEDRHECGIPAGTLSAEEAREIEPHLMKDIKCAIKVPDSAVGPFHLCVASVTSAVGRGAYIEIRPEVTDVLVEGGEVAGIEITHQTGTGSYVHGEPSEIEKTRADHVANATGMWAGQVGDFAGVNVEARPSKGVITIMNTRQTDAIVNRCRPKGDADIVIPYEAACILRTTDEEVEDPEDYPEEGWEVDLMIETLLELVPILADVWTIRSLWGVHPLYRPLDTGTEDPTDITREPFLLDRIGRDDLLGVTSIVSGRLTTYRMATERISNHVYEKLGVSVECRTADKPLLSNEDFTVLHNYMDDSGLRSPTGHRSVQRLGSCADEVLNSVDPNPVIYEYETITRAEIQDALDTAGTDLSSVCIQTRISMGNYQSVTYCHWVVNELAPEYGKKAVHASLDDPYQEHWKGGCHAMWGTQLSQTVLKRVLHTATMNRDEDPIVADADIDSAAFDGDAASDDTAVDGGRERTANHADDDVLEDADDDN